MSFERLFQSAGILQQRRMVPPDALFRSDAVRWRYHFPQRKSVGGHREMLYFIILLL